MIIAYVFTFIALFALFSSTFHKQYQNLYLNEKYFYELYAPYLHRASDKHLIGFNLKHLIDKDPFWCPLFIDTIKAAYQHTSFWYDGLGEDLLQLFQNGLTTQKSDAESSGKFYIENTDDLNHFPMPLLKGKDFSFFLLHSTKVTPDDKEGYMSLLKLLHPSLVSGDSKFDLYSVSPEIIEGVLDKTVAENFRSLKAQYQKREEQGEKNLSKAFYDEFTSVHHLKKNSVYDQLFDPWKNAQDAR